MYQQPIMNNFNPQPAIDRINAQMAELERQKAQLQQPIQPTNLTQNFQLAPSNKEVIKYANSMEEVQRDLVVGDTPYFSKDMSVVWIKNANNQIKTYELTEIVPKDEKDLQIEYLQAQIEELKKGKANEQYITNDIQPEIATDTEWDDKSTRNTTKESKSTSVSRISKSKTK